MSVVSAAILAIFFLCSGHVLAQTRDDFESLSLQRGGLLGLSKSTSFQSIIGFKATQYSSSQEEYFRDQVPGTAGTLLLDLDWYSKHPSREFRIDMRFQHEASMDQSYLKPRELFARWSVLNQESQIALGRMRERFFISERFWKMGLFEPRFFDDKIDPEYGGLTGLFFATQAYQTRMKLLLSPLFIPEFGPDSEIQGGKFVSENPWFRPPPSRVKILGETASEIQYRLNRPAEDEVAFHPGAVLALERGEPQLSGQARLSFAYKPMNQLMLGFPFYGDLSKDDIPVMITINPRVVYHRLTSLEYERNWESGSSILLAAAYENPLRDEVPEEWVRQSSAPATILSSVWQQHFEWRGIDRQVYFGLMNVEGGRAPDEGPIRLSSSVFESRYQYSQVAKLGYMTPVAWWRGRVLLGDFEVLYDRKQNAGLGSARLRMKYNQRWTMQVGADVLGLVRPGSAEVEDGFLRLYRANDRVSAGASYVF